MNEQMMQIKWFLCAIESRSKLIIETEIAQVQG